MRVPPWGPGFSDTGQDAIEDWWEENGDYFHSDHAEEIHSVLDTAVIVIRGSLRESNDLT